MKILQITGKKMFCKLFKIVSIGLSTCSLTGMSICRYACQTVFQKFFFRYFLAAFCLNDPEFFLRHIFYHAHYFNTQKENYVRFTVSFVRLQIHLGVSKDRNSLFANWIRKMS